MSDSSAACCSTAAARPLLPAVDDAAPRRLTRSAFALAIAGWTLAYLLAHPVSELVAFRALQLTPESRLGVAAAFFLYEVPHVLLLLVAVVFLIGVVNTWFTPARVQALLAARGEGVGTGLAALLGIVTPFCSCSAVPLFIGLVEAGVPLGVTFAFLISAPMVNEVALVLLFGLFGWKVAGLYLVTGLAIAIASGFVLGRLRLEAHVESWVQELRCCPAAASVGAPTLGERAWSGAESVRKIVGKTWPYVIAGIAVGSLIHGWVPEGLLASFMGKSAWWSVPLAVGLGVPMYAGTATLIPVVQALLAKGAALGTVLAFMMAVVGLSLPEFIMLRRVLKPKLLGTFVGVVSVGILLVGWLFNLVLA